MADVFSNAYVTVGAPGTRTGAEGLLDLNTISRTTTIHESVDYTVCVLDLVNLEAGTQRDTDDPFSGWTGLDTKARLVKVNLGSPFRLDLHFARST
jgi:hypothetical protein